MTTSASRSPGDEFLSIYLNDHLAGATAGVELARGLAVVASRSPAGPVLTGVSAEIGQDRATLLDIMAALGIRPRMYKRCAGWVAERVRRLKLNGTLGSRSGLTSLIELEMLQLGVEGKTAGWRALRSIADHEPRLDPGQLNELIARARHHAEQLEDLRIRTARRALGAG